MEKIMEWQPIETAPRDGKPILLYTAYGIVEGYMSYGEWEQSVIGTTYDMAYTRFECQPTHWMLLPAPPAN